MKGNRQLQVRLPDDHWIWSIKNARQRNARVKEALDFYYRFADHVEVVRQAAEEIKAVLENGVSPEKIKQEQGDRLFGSLEKFLDL